MVNDRDKLHLMVVAFPDGEPRPAPIPLTGNAIRVGRGADNDLVLPKTAATIAQQHAVFRQIDGSWRVVDQSVNGTYHNDRLLHHEASGPLSLGDRIRLGETVLAVQLVNPPWEDLVLPLTAYADLRKRYTEPMRQLAAGGRMAEEENPQQNA